MPTVAFPVLDRRSPNTPAVPPLLLDTATLPKLVAVPTPNEIVVKPPEAVLPLPSSILTPSPLVVLSPKAKYGAPASTTIPLLAFRDGGSGGTDTSALINGCSLAHLHDGGGGGMSDIALAQATSPLAWLCVGGGGSSEDNGVAVF